MADLFVGELGRRGGGAAGLRVLAERAHEGAHEVGACDREIVLGLRVALEVEELEPGELDAVELEGEAAPVVAEPELARARAARRRSLASSKVAIARSLSGKRTAKLG